MIGRPCNVTETPRTGCRVSLAPLQLHRSRPAPWSSISTKQRRAPLWEKAGPWDRECRSACARIPSLVAHGRIPMYGDSTSQSHVSCWGSPVVVPATYLLLLYVVRGVVRGGLRAFYRSFIGPLHGGMVLSLRPCPTCELLECIVPGAPPGGGGIAPGKDLAKHQFPTGYWNLWCEDGCRSHPTNEIRIAWEKNALALRLPSATRALRRSCVVPSALSCSELTFSQKCALHSWARRCCSLWWSQRSSPPSTFNRRPSHT